MQDPMDYIELELEWADQTRQLPRTESQWHNIFPEFRKEKLADLKKWYKFYQNERTRLANLFKETKNLYAGPPSTHAQVDEKLTTIDRDIRYVDGELFRFGQLIDKYKVKKIKGHITPEDIERAKAIPIHSFDEAKRAGGRYLMLCLFHNDTKPSMVVYKENTYHCFVCEAHGDAIDYIRKREGLDFTSAVKYLNNQ